MVRHSERPSHAEIAALGETDDLDRFHASWPRFIEEWPSRDHHGHVVEGGSFWTYFHVEFDLVKTLHIAESLAFTGCLTPDPRVPTRPLVSSVLDQFSSGEYIDLFGLPEQLGLFLIWRTTNRSNMRFCCAWFQTQVVRRVKAQVLYRLRREFVIGQRIVLGCACLRCDCEWLEAGWRCPLSVFIQSAEYSNSREGLLFREQ